MAYNFGSMSQFDDANSVADPLILVAAKAIKLKPYQGAMYQSLRAPVAPLGRFNKEKFEIYNRSYTSEGGTLAAAIESTNETTITLDTTSLTGITVGHIICVESEWMWVSSITSRSAGTIVVSRAYGGTSAATHLNGTAYTVKGVAINDKDLKNVESKYEGTAKYTNYVQLIAETIDWYKGLELYERKGITNPQQAELLLIEEAATRVAAKLAYSAVHGKKQLGTSSLPYATAGVLEQLQDTSSGTRPTQTYNVNGTFTETKLRAALQQKAAAAGGFPDTIWCSWTNKEIINNFLKSSTLVTDLDRKVAGYSIDKYNYDGTMLDVKVDADMPDDKIAITSSDMLYAMWVEGDGLSLVDEPTKSSREKRKSITGSFGIAVEGVGYDHILLYGIS